MKRKITSVIISLLVISLIFSFFDKTHWNGLTEEQNLNERFFNRLYFTTTTFSTAGYGDITPKSKLLRFFVICSHLLILFQVVI